MDIANIGTHHPCTVVPYAEPVALGGLEEAVERDASSRTMVF